jgi:hypothetical protein
MSAAGETKAERRKNQKRRISPTEEVIGPEK